MYTTLDMLSDLLILAVAWVPGTFLLYRAVDRRYRSAVRRERRAWRMNEATKTRERR